MCVWHYTYGGFVHIVMSDVDNLLASGFLLIDCLISIYMSHGQIIWDGSYYWASKKKKLHTSPT